MAPTLRAFVLFIVGAPLVALGEAPATQPGGSDRWGEFRNHQRQELAATTRPADPSGNASAHPIDRFMSSWWEGEKIPSPAACSDAHFARRAWLDAVGLVPSEAELKAFLEDTRPDKRERLVERLLSDSDAYAEGWMAYWCDLLRNDEQTNIDDLRTPISKWLFAALRANMPYDQMVCELLDPAPDGPFGYLKGINWRGSVNASQSPPMQAAQNVGQVFMGTNIKCASCHDHFTRPYLLEETYGLASFFSEKNLEVHRCDKPTGVIAAPEFILPGFARVPADANLAVRHQAVSRMVTSPRNPRFARTMVNRLWKRLMGRGLVEPADDFHAKAANPELLDWLAYDFMKNDYDLKHTIRLLMISKAYGLRSVQESADDVRRFAKQSPVFVGPPLRRLGSEQFMDAVSQLTGEWPQFKTMAVDVSGPRIRAWREKVPGALARSLGRPSREQVCTMRVEDASMLQMLEMTNGKELATRLQAGARTLLSSSLAGLPVNDALDLLCIRAFARPASAEEKEQLVPLLGSPGDGAEKRQAGWEDVCWILVMNPEFQYIQ